MRPDEVRIEIAGTPVAKGRPRFARRGNAVMSYTPDKTAKHEASVGWYAQQAMNGRQPLECAVAVDIWLLMPIPQSTTKKTLRLIESADFHHTKKPDADNLAKALLDGINGIVIRDDAQIVDLRIYKRYSSTPRSLMTIRAMHFPNEAAE